MRSAPESPPGPLGKRIAGHIVLLSLFIGYVHAETLTSDAYTWDAYSLRVAQNLDTMITDSAQNVDSLENSAYNQLLPLPVDVSVSAMTLTLLHVTRGSSEAYHKLNCMVVKQPTSITKLHPRGDPRMQ